MRKQLKDYIKENIMIKGTPYTEDEIDEFKKWWSKVENQCAPFLKEIKKCDGFIYRGMREADGITHKNVRKDRHPKDTNPELHRVFDDVLNDLFGWKPRSEGLFCTGKKNTASTYGRTYIIFPVGRFEYVWSDKIDDLYSDTNDIYISNQMIVLLESGRVNGKISMVKVRMGCGIMRDMILVIQIKKVQYKRH